jgi:hypothetical protein
MQILLEIAHTFATILIKKPREVKFLLITTSLLNSSGKDHHLAPRQFR